MFDPLDSFPLGVVSGCCRAEVLYIVLERRRLGYCTVMSFGISSVENIFPY
jgi:hypothetical protein